MIRKILLTNDDGVNSVGFSLLYEHLNKKYDVIVLVPEIDYSGSVNKAHYGTKISINKVDSNIYTISVNPILGVIFALTTYFKNEDIDLVVSGINLGLNVGIRKIFSNTYNSISVAFRLGKSGIAINTDTVYNSPNEPGFHTSLYVLDKILEEFNFNAKSYSLNINVPNVIKEKITDIKYFIDIYKELNVPSEVFDKVQDDQYIYKDDLIPEIEKIRQSNMVLVEMKWKFKNS